MISCICILCNVLLLCVTCFRYLKVNVFQRNYCCYWIMPLVQCCQHCTLRSILYTFWPKKSPKYTLYSENTLFVKIFYNMKCIEIHFFSSKNTLFYHEIHFLVTKNTLSNFTMLAPLHDFLTKLCSFGMSLFTTHF